MGNVSGENCTENQDTHIRFSNSLLPNIKFHENPSSGSRVVARGLASERTDGRTDTKKLPEEFRNFAKAPTTN